MMLLSVEKNHLHEVSYVCICIRRWNFSVGQHEVTYANHASSREDVMRSITHERYDEEEEDVEGEEEEQCAAPPAKGDYGDPDDLSDCEYCHVRGGWSDAPPTGGGPMVLLIHTIVPLQLKRMMKTQKRNCMNLILGSNCHPLSSKWWCLVESCLL